jgi:hypothetical protein
MISHFFFLYKGEKWKRKPVVVQSGQRGRKNEEKYIEKAQMS